jgi:hypothetical protein
MNYLPGLAAYALGVLLITAFILLLDRGSR